GKVVLLVDESTVSHAEYSAMGLQAATHTITIGNTTAGQNGDISERFWLPGGVFSRFSGLGIRYFDGTPMQRRGIKIDIRVRPTIKGLQDGRDEVLETAIKYLFQRPNAGNKISFSK
ncbi:MAG TPA: S41 family peptidase, partial [Flavisolibacter sp.]|nr:S41 family peptidase [Flavisolibacter sp.]